MFGRRWLCHFAPLYTFISNSNTYIEQWREDALRIHRATDVEKRKAIRSSRSIKTIASSKSVIYTQHTHSVPIQPFPVCGISRGKLLGGRGRSGSLRWRKKGRAPYIYLLCMEELLRRRRMEREEQSFIAYNILWKFPSLLHFLCPFIVSAVSPASFHPNRRFSSISSFLLSLPPLPVWVPGPFMSGLLSYRLHTHRHTQSVQEQQQAQTSSQCLCCQGTTDWYHDRLPAHFQKGRTSPLDCWPAYNTPRYNIREKRLLLLLYYMYYYYYIYFGLPGQQQQQQQQPERRMSAEKKREICMQQSAVI